MKVSAWPSAQEARALTGFDFANLSDRDIGRLGCSSETIGFGRRHRANDLVVVATGERGFQRCRSRRR